MNKLKLNQRGFSLIELMAVVLIIGVLAAVAVPNYQRFQRKARQTEAKTNLAAMYTAERTFISEWSYGTTNLDLIGYDSTGELFYVVGWHTGDATEKDNTINATSGQPTRYRGPVPLAGTTDHVNTAETNPNGFHIDADSGVQLSRSRTCVNSAATSNNTCCEVSGANCQAIGAVSSTCNTAALAAASCGYESHGVINTTAGLDNVGFTIRARADIGGSDNDEWEIDHSKAMRNPLSGL